MSTFLKNARMAPALAARVEASIRKSRPGGAAFDRRLVAIFRVVTLLGIVGATVSLALLRHREDAQLERSRAALLDAVRAQSASLSSDDRAAVTRAEVWLVRFSGPYEGDFIAGELRAPGALDGVLARPSLYVRGPLSAFGNAAAIEKAAETSVKDAFVLCLVERPPVRTEKVLLTKVHAAYAGGARLQERTANVHRLHDAALGLPLLQPAWAARVRAAEKSEELALFEQVFKKAPIAEAKKAASAHLLLFAMDEPGDSLGLSELDGERPHDVRIGLVDLTAGKVLLRLRRRADPSFISVPKRASYASGLDGCALAFDVHASIEEASTEKGVAP